MTPVVDETDDIAACHALRQAIFIDEQGIPADEEWDDLDDGATYLLARDAKGTALGCARLLSIGDTGKIGRICVVPAARGTGLGAALMRAGLERLRADTSLRRVVLGAQVQAMGFYEKHGFTAFSKVYDDGGVPHRDMELPL